MHHHHTRVAKYNEDDGGIFDNLFWILITLSFRFKNYII
jgi:hypothetical protein